MATTKTRKTTKTTKSTKATSAVDSLASISAEDFDSQSEKLAGKERLAKLQVQTKKIEGVLLKSDEQEVKNLALADRVNHAESVTRCAVANDGPKTNSGAKPTHLCHG